MKKLYLLSILMLVSLMVSAQTKRIINVETAKEKALHFIASDRAKTRSNVVILTETQSDDGYFAFNIGNGEGYVLVSSNDQTNDIIGYSTKGIFDLSSMPISMRSWMRSYSKALTNLSSKVKKVAHKSRQPIPALLKTYWDQTGPYALQCPKVKQPGISDSPEYETPAGCVATAMAQIIYYYQWPEKLPALPGYTTGTLKISLPELPSTSIDYDILRSYYFIDELDNYLESAEEVSKLMRYCGQSCKMDYHPMGSGAGFTVETMAEFWGYTKKAKSIYRPNFKTIEEWEDIIYNELAEGRPVPYSGMSFQDGHHFICDGYDGNGFFHLNFGWQGLDGFFDLSICDAHYGMASFTFSDDGFCYQQRAIIGLEPAKTDETGVEIEYDPIVEQNGEVAVNSIEMGMARAGSYFSLIHLNLTGLSDIEITNLYLFLDGERNGQTTVYLAKGQTKDSYMHVLCFNEGIHHISICSDPEGKHVLAETDAEFNIPTESSYNLVVSADLKNATNGVVDDDCIKVGLTITNQSNNPYDDEFQFVLSKRHENEALSMLSQFRKYVKQIHIPAHNSIKLDVEFTDLPKGTYLISPYYWSDLNFKNSDEYWWITLTGVNNISKESITISSAKQSTYCSDKNLDFSNKPEVKAYVATGYDKTTGTIWLTRVKDVPANTGFLLMGDAGNYVIPVKEGVSDSYYVNLFKGTLTSMKLQATDGANTNYYLSNGSYGVGFYKPSSDGVDLGANRAYLSVPTDIQAVGAAGGTETINVSSALQMTYCSNNSLDFTDWDQVKAYTATGYNYNSGTIWLTRVKKVPAGTGILIMAPEGSYPITKASVASVYANMFVGTLEGKTIQTEEKIGDVDYINYYLSAGKYGVGFYKVGSEGIALSANRSYLPIKKRAAVAGTRGISSDTERYGIRESDDVISIRLFNGADATRGINSVEKVKEEADAYYNLQGQRVNNPGKGLYIKNGKKVVIK